MGISAGGEDFGRLFDPEARQAPPFRAGKEPGRSASRCQRLLLRENGRESDLPPGRREVTPREIRRALVRPPAQEPTVSAAQAAA